MNRATDPQGFSHPCRWSRTLYVVGPLILLGFVWLATTVIAGELERRELKTKLEQMVADVAEIKLMIKKYTEKP